MAQIISCSSSSESSITHQKSPTSIPLSTSSKGSSLVKSKQQSPDLALDTEVPLVAINFSGTSPSSHLLPSSVLTKPQTPPRSLLNRQSAEFDKSVLVGLGFGSGLGLGSGSDNAHARRRMFQEKEDDEEEGSDLGLVNVSPITYTASGVASPTEETFARATQHLRRGSDARQKREDISKITIAKEEEELRGLMREKERKERPRTGERESSEDVIVVPDLRQGGESGMSAAEARRRRRRLERRQSAPNTPVVSPEVVQRGWGRRG